MKTVAEEMELRRNTDIKTMDKIDAKETWIYRTEEGVCKRQGTSPERARLQQKTRECGCHVDKNKTLK